MTEASTSISTSNLEIIEPLTKLGIRAGQGKIIIETWSAVRVHPDSVLLFPAAVPGPLE